MSEHDPLCQWEHTHYRCDCPLIEKVIERTEERLTDSLYREIEEQVREQEWKRLRAAMQEQLDIYTETSRHNDHLRGQAYAWSYVMGLLAERQ
jgi:hypothetical protein